MKIRLHRNFEKKFAKRSDKEKIQTQERLELFLFEPYHSLLKNHPLRGRFLNYRSINIDGDLRAIYKYLSDDECLFVDLDSHSNLYS